MQIKVWPQGFYLSCTAKRYHDKTVQTPHAKSVCTTKNLAVTPCIHHVTTSSIVIHLLGYSAIQLTKERTAKTRQLRYVRVRLQRDHHGRPQGAPALFGTGRSNALRWTSKSAPNMTVFNAFGFQIVKARGVLTLFGSWTAKSASNPSVFNTFDFQMVKSPHVLALFDHSSRQIAPHPPF
jgi:hypothetical protein